MPLNSPVLIEKTAEEADSFVCTRVPFISQLKVQFLVDLTPKSSTSPSTEAESRAGLIFPISKPVEYDAGLAVSGKESLP